MHNRKSSAFLKINRQYSLDSVLEGKNSNAGAAWSNEGHLFSAPNSSGLVPMTNMLVHHLNKQVRGKTPRIRNTHCVGCTRHDAGSASEKTAPQRGCLGLERTPHPKPRMSLLDFLINGRLSSQKLRSITNTWLRAWSAES